MRKSLTAAMAAVTLGGAMVATAMPADARSYHGGYHGGGYHGGYHGGGYYRGHGYGAGPAIAAGVVGLAVGAAIAGNHGGYYDRGYYGGRAYYPGYAYGGAGYGYAPGYAVCDNSHWVWDPYARRNVFVRSSYAC